MFTKILASVGIGIGVFIALYFIDFIRINMQRHVVPERLYPANVLMSFIAIAAYFIIIGMPVLKTLGLCCLLFVPIDFIMFPFIQTFLPEKGRLVDEDERRGAAYSISSSINMIITAVFAVLIINHFGLI